MKNGKYELIVAPANYPGKLYRGKYAYEHTIVWWKNSGNMPAKGYEIHHINGNHRDNRIENLQLLTSKEHKLIHGAESHNKVKYVTLQCGNCGTDFDLTERVYKSRIKYTESGKLFCGKSCQVSHQQKQRWSKIAL